MPSAHYVHPEFGYFCLGPGLRRVLRVAVVSILFGIIIEASVIRLRAGHDRQADNAWTTAHIEPSRAAAVLPAATEPGSSLTGNAATGAPNGATSQLSAKAKKHQRIARTQTRRRNDEDINHDQRASYWSGRGSIDAQHRRGGYRAWAYGGPRSWGWF